MYYCFIWVEGALNPGCSSTPTPQPPPSPPPRRMLIGWLSLQPAGFQEGLWTDPGLSSKLCKINRLLAPLQQCFQSLKRLFGYRYFPCSAFLRETQLQFLSLPLWLLFQISWPFPSSSSSSFYPAEKNICPAKPWGSETKHRNDINIYVEIIYFQPIFSLLSRQMW